MSVCVGHFCLKACLEQINLYKAVNVGEVSILIGGTLLGRGRWQSFTKFCQ